MKWTNWYCFFPLKRNKQYIFDKKGNEFYNFLFSYFPESFILLSEVCTLFQDLFLYYCFISKILMRQKYWNITTSRTGWKRKKSSRRKLETTNVNTVELALKSSWNNHGGGYYFPYVIWPELTYSYVPTT